MNTIMMAPRWIILEKIKTVIVLTGELPHLSVWLVLVFRWRSRHMCLFSESTTVF
jgi:hypothetical protein